MKVSLNRKMHFNCGHKYENPSFSVEKNKKTFGACVGEHGHNYNLVVNVTGEVCKDTGMIINLNQLDPLIHSVCEKLDHKFLNTDVEYFFDKIPTTENIGIYIYNILKPQLSKLKVTLNKITLYENENLWAEVCGE